MRKKVLFVVHQLNHGGVQKALLSALDAVDYSENDVTLYIRKDRLDLIDGVNKNVSRIIINDDKRHYDKTFYALLLQSIMITTDVLRLIKVSKELKKRLIDYMAKKQIAYEKKFFSGEKYDVAISYIQGYPALLVSDCVDADRKIVFFHGSEDENHELHEVIFKNFDKIVGVSSGVKKILCDLYPSYNEKIIHLDNYVDAEKIIEKSREYSVEKPSDIVLCSCGRIAPIKGFDMAVDAARILKEKGYDFKWFIIGDGPQRAEIENMAVENKLDNYFDFVGMKDNPYPYIELCDIYVQSSYAEAQPLSIIEAQILQRPVISTKTVGGRALIKNGETGILTEISASGIADGIMKLIENPELRRKISDNLRKTDYDAEKERYKKQWENLLEA